jgi:hypothetical protein
VGREPEVGVEDGTHHFHRVARERQMMSDEEAEKFADAGDDNADRILPEALED